MDSLLFTADIERAKEFAFEKATLTGTAYYVKELIYGTDKDKSEYQAIPEKLVAFKNSERIKFKTNGEKSSKRRSKQ